MVTLLSKMDMLENHMRFALKDVSTMQIEVAKFKEKVDTEVKEYND
jgi:FtsZ-binding cell division protein ZapB